MFKAGLMMTNHFSVNWVINYMDEDKVLISFVEGRISKCRSQFEVTYTNFLDTAQQSQVLTRFSKESDVKTMLYGGFEDAERQVAVFVPDFLNVSSFEEIEAYFAENPDENPLTVIRIKKDNFSKIGHRDYLGALMALGIKREMLGDILISDSGADLIAMRQISAYIINELHSAGRATLNTKEINFQEISKASFEVKQGEICVTSMRLDGIISACFKVSRSGAADAIASGCVFVNSVQITKGDKKVSLGDKIVYRSKGKVILKEQTGTSKKGRNFIKIDIYS